MKYTLGIYKMYDRAVNLTVRVDLRVVDQRTLPVVIDRPLRSNVIVTVDVIPEAGAGREKRVKIFLIPFIVGRRIEC